MALPGAPPASVVTMGLVAAPPDGAASVALPAIYLALCPALVWTLNGVAALQSVAVTELRHDKHRGLSSDRSSDHWEYASPKT